MKGTRTLIVNGATAVIMAILTWAIGVDWTQYVSPTVAIIIVNVANFALRFITDTPIFKSTPTPE